MFWLKFSGTISVGYMLNSKNFIDDRTIQKVNRITRSMMENGMYEFYNSYTHFQSKLHGHSKFIPEADDDDITPLTFQQMRRFMVFTLSLYGIAVLLFVCAEFFVFKWKNWRDRK